jgi:hypothetical protein
MATKGQTWALFCGTGLDCRGIELSVNHASMLIDSMKAGNDITPALLKLGATGTPKVNKSAQWAELWAKADAAGKEAVEKCVPTPMVVAQHANPLDDGSPVTRAWHVPQGVCGFAWVKITPGNCSFAIWAKKNLGARKDYYGGVSVWVSEYGQSMELKEAYARGAAKILQEGGIKAYAGSRMD